MGKTTKQNLAYAENWLIENKFEKKYKILEWGGKSSAPSLFLDLQRNKEFKIKFSNFIKRLKNNPDCIFGASTEEIQKSRENSVYKKYGVKSVSQLLSVKDKVKEVMTKEKKQISIQKMKQTRLKKYGTLNLMDVPEVRDKISATNLSLYGAPNYFATTNFRNEQISRGKIKIINGKTLKELALEKQINYTTFCQKLLKFGPEKINDFKAKQTNIEFKIEELLKSLGVSYIKEYRIWKTYVPDFFIPSNNLIIETDGLYWHSDVKNNDHKYHLKKKQFYNSQNCMSLFFRENEIYENFNIVSSIIKNHLKLNKKIYARKCSIRKSSNNSFFKENHLMSSGRGKIYELIYEGEIVSAIQVLWSSIPGSKWETHKTLEISRFCSLNNTTVIGGFSKLINAIIKDFSPRHITTFIDKRYGSGEYLKDLGWKLVNEDLSFCWVDLQKSIVFHRSNFKSNSGYEQGLFKLWDCGQAKWQLDIK